MVLSGVPAHWLRSMIKSNARYSTSGAGWIRTSTRFANADLLHIPRQNPHRQLGPFLSILGLSRADPGSLARNGALLCPLAQRRRQWSHERAAADSSTPTPRRFRLASMANGSACPVSRFPGRRPQIYIWATKHSPPRRLHRTLRLI